MATRRILLIDNDLSFFSQLTQIFSPYQILVQQAEPSEESLSLALEQEAVLVFIAVNLPEKLGFSLCHKAKKILRVPVVLNTVTIPPEGFDKHRRLRSRADGYLDKRTTSPEQILAVVGSLIELGSPVESDDSSDLEMPFGDFPLDLSEQFVPEERTAVATTAFLDEEIAEETDAAFAVMAMGEDPTKEASGAMSLSSANPASTMLDLATASPNETLQGHGFDDASSGEQPSAPPPEEEYQRRAPEQSEAVPGVVDLSQLASDDSDEFELDISTVVRVDNVDGDSTALTNIGAQEGVVPLPRPFEEEEEGIHVPESPASIAVELGLDTVVASAAQDQEEAATITPKELAALRSENTQLKKNASKSLSSDNGFSREHEFLALRERINKKEKALLDSQDLLTTKDRRILDLSDELRGLERKRADLDENILDLEQRNLKKKEDLAALEQSLRALGDTLAKNEETYTAALAAKEVAHNTEAESREEKHSTEVAELEEKHRATLETTKAKMAQAQRESEATLLSLSKQAATTAEEHLKKAVAKAQQDCLTAAKADYEQREKSLRSEKAEELEAAKRQFDEDLAQTLEKHASKLEALTAEASAEKERALAAASAEYKVLVEELKSSHEVQVAKLGEQRAAAEQEASRAQEVSNKAHEKVLREMETRAKDLEIALSSSRNTLSEREEQLLGLRALITEGNSALAAKDEELATRNTLVGSLEHDKEELTEKNLSYEQQVLAAYKKIKYDEATMGKATKALAIALTLLDETRSSTPPEKSTATCQDSPPQDSPPQVSPPQQSS